MMEDVCTQVIDVLSSMSFPDPLTMLQCGLRFDYPAWVRQGYRELVLRQDPLSIEEAKALGLENAVRCVAARETYRSVNGTLQIIILFDELIQIDPHRCQLGA